MRLRLEDVGPGTLLVHYLGTVQTVSRRKEDNTGWWLTDGSGISYVALRKGWDTDWRAADGLDGRRFFAALHAEDAS